ncbi:MAG: hypothetical protein ACRDT4_26415 [Micromonosporaceae bacterium]
MDPSAIREHIEDLSAALATWSDRDDTQPQPHVRRAANTAVGAIDAALCDLHELRGRLLTEIRTSDDATAARVDRLLAKYGGGR